MKPLVDDMVPDLKVKFSRFAALMAEAGVPFALTCVLRTPAEQTAYFAQGREPLEKVNALRAAAGMAPLPATENRYKVTQTRNSRHFPAADGKSRAFDIVILKGDRKPTWDVKWDGDRDNIADYEEAARIGEAVGLVAGARWKSFQDWPHFELKI